MLRKALFILALLLPVASRAAGETALPPDSLKTKVVRTARKVDHFLLKNQQKQTTNTDYIFKPQQKWLFRTRSDLVFNLNEFHYDHRGTLLDYGMDLKAKPLFRKHFGVGYRGVILGFGIAIPFKNKDKEFSLKVYANRLGGEVTYGSIGSYQGTMDLLGMEFDVKPGDMPSHYIRVGGYYAFNWKKFSMPAAMTQAFIQRKSAGSPLATVGFRANWGEYRPNKSRNRHFFFGIGGGYGYNWVPSEHWLLHISATETLGLVGVSRIAASKDNVTKFGMRFLPLLTAGNAAVIFYYKRFYTGLFATADVLFIPTQERQHKGKYFYTMSHVTAHLTVGFRL